MKKFKRFSLAFLLLMITFLSVVFSYCAHIAFGHSCQDAASKFLAERNCFLIESANNDSTVVQPFVVHFDDIGYRLVEMPIHPHEVNTSPWFRLRNEGCASLFIPDRATIQCDELTEMIEKLRWLKNVTIHDQHELSEAIPDLNHQFPNIEFASSGLKVAW